eukprot:1157315-Pelagomonas_calceolata.AAC.6
MKVRLTQAIPEVHSACLPLATLRHVKARLTQDTLEARSARLPLATNSNPKACESKAQSRTHNTTHSVYAPSASATWRRVKARLTQEYAVWMKELEGRLPSVHRACVA